MSNNSGPDWLHHDWLTYIVATQGSVLRVRKGPGTRYPIIGSLAPGQRIHAAPRGLGWCELRRGGWVSKKLLKRSQSVQRQPSTSITPGRFRVDISSGHLNVRAGAGTNYPVRDRLLKGATVQVVKVKSDWAQLKNGLWVATQYLEEISQVDTDRGEGFEQTYFNIRTRIYRTGIQLFKRKVPVFHEPDEFFQKLQKYKNLQSVISTLSAGYKVAMGGPLISLSFVQQLVILMKNTYGSLKDLETGINDLGKILGYADTMARLVHNAGEVPEGEMPSAPWPPIPDDIRQRFDGDQRWSAAYRAGTGKLFAVLGEIERMKPPLLDLPISYAEIYVVEMARHHRKRFRSNTRDHLLSDVLDIQFKQSIQRAIDNAKDQ